MKKDNKIISELIDIESIEELSNAIVKQAFDDYISALAKEKKLDEAVKKNNERLKDCMRFFKSDWCKQLTNVEPKVIIKIAEIKAKYSLWRDALACNSCPKSCQECIHKKELDSWKEWHEGNRKCLKRKRCFK